MLGNISQEYTIIQDTKSSDNQSHVERSPKILRMFCQSFLSEEELYKHQCKTSAILSLNYVTPVYPLASSKIQLHTSTLSSSASGGPPPRVSLNCFYEEYGEVSGGLCKDGLHQAIATTSLKAKCLQSIDCSFVHQALGGCSQIATLCTFPFRRKVLLRKMSIERGIAARWQ